MDDNLDGRKITTDEESSRTISKTSSVDSSHKTLGSAFFPRHQSWQKLRLSQDGLWALGEQEEVSDEYPEKYEEPCTSETEETPTPDSQEKSEVSVSSEALSNVYSKLSPFNIQWAFGINLNVQIINLTTKESFEVFYVAAHFGVIYNTGTDTMTFLPGHNYLITSIASDVTGRWLVTADEGEDTVIIIWDRMKKLPVWSLYNVFPKGVRCVNISQDARFLAAADCNLNQVKFWLWTYGRDEPDEQFEVDQAAGTAKHINFNHLHTEQFVVTMEYTVVFCKWEETTRTIEKHFPKLVTGKKKLGYLRQSIFLDDSHTALSSTSQGYVVVWTDIKYTDVQVPGTEGTIYRNFLKAIRLHKAGIMSLCLCDGIVATAAEDGIIMFHDQQCRLLYCLSKPQADPIMSLSFNIESIHCSTDPFALDKKSGQEEVQQVLEYDVSFEKPDSVSTEDLEEIEEEEKADLCSEELPWPLDCTLEAKTFFIRDFMFLNAKGQIGYVSHRREKVKYYLTEVEAPILALDCNPNKCHVAMANSLGRITLYDHNKKKKLLSAVFPSAITTLKYSNFGHSIMAGFQNGDILQLDSLLLTVKYTLESSKAALEKLCFSPRDDIIAYYDRSSIISVHKKRDPTKWTSMGKYMSHYKPIVDIMFLGVKENSRMCRLFTIGQDRMLVEYDMNNLEENKLKIIHIIRIEQTAIPLCFTSIDKFYTTPHFLVSNNQYKLKVIDADEYTCKKTTLGPTADTPIGLMKVINDLGSPPDKAKMVYVTDKHIGIRILPPTGNPFEGMGMVAHTTKLIAVALSHDHKHLFSLGVDDTCPLMWELNPTSVDVASQLGGNDLEPFVSLIEGGPNSFLFKELEDFFYYAQIIHQGEDPNLDRSVSKKLALCEIPDLFRALGYYPTDYEVNNLLNELRNLNYEETKEIREEITFEECVKAFLNHRPVEPTTLADVNNALLAIADISDPSDIIIERNELFRALEERAEAMEHVEALGYLCILLLPKDEDNPFPHSLRLHMFAKDVLGIDLTITEENVRQITHAFENQPEE